MRKGKNNHELNIDLLLRETAAQENDTLPLEDWKRQLFKKIESDDQPQREEASVADELAARRHRNLRKLTIGFSTVAAALIILLGTRQYWQENLNAKAAPQDAQMEIRMAEEAAPYDAAPSGDALPEALYAAPEAPAALEAPAPAAIEPPASTGGSTEAPAAPAPSVSADNGAGAGQAQAGILSGPEALTAEQQQAVDAVNALLPETRGKVDAATALVMLLKNATITVRPLSGGEAVERAEVTRPRIYQVMADPTVEGAPSYAVDADTYEVLGEIVEG